MLFTSFLLVISVLNDVFFLRQHLVPVFKRLSSKGLKSFREHIKKENRRKNRSILSFFAKVTLNPP